MKEKKMMLDEMLDGAVEALYDMVMQALCALCPEDTPEDTPERREARRRRKETRGALLRIAVYGHPGKDPLFHLGE